MKELNPNQKIAEVFYRFNVGIPIDDMLEDVFKLILTNPQVMARDVQLGSFLTGLMIKGSNSKEIVSLIRTALNIDGLIRFKPSLPLDEKLVCVAGSGKKGFKTFNISTPACIVAAAGGAYVSKPGSHSTSSLTGSVDFASIAGANILSTQEMTEVLLSTKFGLFSIENLIPKFDSVYGGRAFAPTPLSFGLPAISNPVVCDSLLYGLSHPNIELSLEVLKDLGYKEAFVVSSSYDNIHYIDELSSLKSNLVGRIENGEIHSVEEIDVSKIYNEKFSSPTDIESGKSLIENVQMGVSVLNGKGTSYRTRTVALNAGIILLLASKVNNIIDGYNYSIDLIKSGKAFKKLEDFIEATGGNTNSLKMLKGG
mgnify:CR=1 FL=1